MQLEKITLEELLGELEELPSDWMDEKAQALVAHIRVSLGRLPIGSSPRTAASRGCPSPR